MIQRIKSYPKLRIEVLNYIKSHFIHWASFDKGKILCFFNTEHPCINGDMYVLSFLQRNLWSITFVSYNNNKTIIYNKIGNVNESGLVKYFKNETINN